jgi:hypothetical protein
MMAVGVPAHLVVDINNDGPLIFMFAAGNMNIEQQNQLLICKGIDKDGAPLQR